MATPEDREEILSDMHDLVTATLLEAVNRVRKDIAEGEKPNANVLAKAIDWLKHNNIDLTHRPSKNLEDLANSLPFPSKEEVEDFAG